MRTAALDSDARKAREEAHGGDPIAISATQFRSEDAEMYEGEEERIWAVDVGGEFKYCFF